MASANRLNPEQHQAAYCFDAPVCILAGAGTGKTKTITERIAALIQEEHVAPASILALTFTNKAAAEMRERVEHILGYQPRGLEIGTFHARVARWCRQFPEAIGRSSYFTIIDETDRNRLLKDLVKKRQVPAGLAFADIKHDIHMWQCAGLHPDDLVSHPILANQTFARTIYTDFIHALDRSNTTDFGHLLLLGQRLLATPQAALFKARIQHVVVDEYQDTSPAQTAILNQFFSHAKTIAIVGDDDQAIYGWRGAAPDTMKRFLQQHPSARLVKLETNYRSSSQILDAANDVIQVNTNRLGKSLLSNHGDGPSLQFFVADDDVHEARLLADRIHTLINQGTSSDDIAILYRKNAMSRPLETALRRARVGYQIIGGIRFFDKAIIKNILATLRLLLNPHSAIDLSRFLKAFPHGIGQKTLGQIVPTIDGDLISGFRALTSDSHPDLSPRMLKKVITFGHRLEELRRPLIEQTASLAELIQELLTRLGLLSQLELDVDRQTEREDVQDFLQLIHQYEYDCERQNTSPTLISFLEEAALLSSTDTATDATHISLMTIHAAKGLEFEHVFVIGCEEHQFPTSQAIEDAEGGDTSTLEEERRLMYVAMTRAKRHLTLSRAKRRQHHGTFRHHMPSRFLRDILVYAERQPSQTFGSSRHSLIRRRTGDRPMGRRGQSIHSPIEIEDDVDTSMFVSGDRVTHTTFGAGEVVGLRGLGSRRAALVRFDSTPTRSRTVVLAHLEPEKSSNASSVHEPQIDMSFDFGA